MRVGVDEGWEDDGFREFVELGAGVIFFERGGIGDFEDLLEDLLGSLARGAGDALDRTCDEIGDVIRSKKGSSPGRAANSLRGATTSPYCSGTASNVSFRLPARGHQNSSASLWMIQSAPNSIARRVSAISLPRSRSPPLPTRSSFTCPARS